MGQGCSFAGLPEEFAPPEKAAERIAELKTIAEREAYWLRIPENWRGMIGHFTVAAIAGVIAELPTKFDRQNALAAVPELWRYEVRWFVLRIWKANEIRAKLKAEENARPFRRQGMA